MLVAWACAACSAAPPSPAVVSAPAQTFADRFDAVVAPVRDGVSVDPDSGREVTWAGEDGDAVGLLPAAFALPWTVVAAALDDRGPAPESARIFVGDLDADGHNEALYQAWRRAVPPRHPGAESTSGFQLLALVVPSGDTVRAALLLREPLTEDPAWREPAVFQVAAVADLDAVAGAEVVLLARRRLMELETEDLGLTVWHLGRGEGDAAIVVGVGALDLGTRADAATELSELVAVGLAGAAVVTVTHVLDEEGLATSRLEGWTIGTEDLQPSPRRAWVVLGVWPDPDEALAAAARSLAPRGEMGVVVVSDPLARHHVAAVGPFESVPGATLDALQASFPGAFIAPDGDLTSALRPLAGLPAVR